MSLPRVSAIVVSYNRSQDLRLSLEALIDTEYPNLEILVVDNASTDDAVSVAESFPGVIVIRNSENLGFAEANNIGLERATGDYVALINNDAVVAKDWLEKMVRFLESHPQTAAAGGKIYDWNEASPLGNRKNGYFAYTQIDPDTGYGTALRNTPDEIREVATLSGAVVMIRRKAIDDVGHPFLEPTFFTYYEETDFFARAIRKGWTLHYIGEPAAWHRVRASTAAEPYRYFYYMARNRLLYVHRNFDDASLAKALKGAAREAFSDITNLPRELLGKEEEARRARRDAYLWLLSHRAMLREQRARSLAVGGISYNECLRTIRTRSEYYGHERPEVVALVPESAKFVVDVGCGAGGLGRALKRNRPGVEVRGIEIVPEQAERAKRVLDDVRIGSAEDVMPEDWPRPDCVIFADVLEHLVDPWSVLRNWRSRLAPGGSIVVSLPNVGYREVVSGVLRGRWDYRDAGVLDRTHLRFFTRSTAIELLEGSGFRVARIDRVLDSPGRYLASRIPRKLRRPSLDGLGSPARFAADLYTVQFLLVAV